MRRAARALAVPCSAAPAGRGRAVAAAETATAAARCAAGYAGLVPNRASGLDWDRRVDEASGEGVPAGARATRLSAQAIVETAIAVADQDGLDAVSIRRVATQLGVRPMSLYTHIASKEELLARMANELVGLMLLDPPPSGDWREKLSATARRFHAVFVEHPWALAVVARHPRPGPNAMGFTKQLAGTVAELELAPHDMWTLLGIVNDYVLGHALRVGTRGVARALDATRFDVTELPELAALPDYDATRGSVDNFEIGLQAVLDGVVSRFLPSAGGAKSSSDGASPATPPA